MNPIFITGVTGLLGQHFANYFAERGVMVKGMARNIDSPPKLCQHPNITLVSGDILDITTLREEIETGATVVHCAAMVSFNPKDKSQLFKVNHEGTENLVNTCLGNRAKKLLFVSSVAALGKPSNVLRSTEKVLIDEDQMWLDGPENSNYAKSKFLAETEVWRGHAEGLPVVVINPSVILGEDNWNNSSSRLFKYVWDRNRFQTDGFLNYVDVQDVVKASAELLSDESMANERYILNAGRVKLDTFFKTVADQFEKPVQRKTLSPFLINILWRFEYIRSLLTGSNPLITKETAISARLNVLFDHSKVKYTLSFTFTPLEESLTRITDYYMKGYQE